MRWIPTIITDVGDADEVELETKPGVSGQQVIIGGEIIANTILVVPYYHCSIMCPKTLF